MKVFLYSNYTFDASSSQSLTIWGRIWGIDPHALLNVATPSLHVYLCVLVQCDALRSENKAILMMAFC